MDVHLELGTQRLLELEEDQLCLVDPCPEMLTQCRGQP
jgi:hypothetical protein